MPRVNTNGAAVTWVCPTCGTHVTTTYGLGDNTDGTYVTCYADNRAHRDAPRRTRNAQPDRAAQVA